MSCSIVNIANSVRDKSQGNYRAQLEDFSQVARMLQASSGRSGKHSSNNIHKTWLKPFNRALKMVNGFFVMIPK